VSEGGGRGDCGVKGMRSDIRAREGTAKRSVGVKLPHLSRGEVSEKTGPSFPFHHTTERKRKGVKKRKEKHPLTNGTGNLPSRTRKEKRAEGGKKKKKPNRQRRAIWLDHAVLTLATCEHDREQELARTGEVRITQAKLNRCESVGAGRDNREMGPLGGNRAKKENGPQNNVGEGEVNGGGKKRLATSFGGAPGVLHTNQVRGRDGGESCLWGAKA